jgi:predicted dehydrogenase
MTDTDQSAYGLSQIRAADQVAAPDLSYLPPRPRSYRPCIGLIGTGGISEYHLRAYRTMGLDVVVLCDLQQDRAERRKQEFFPEARVVGDYRQILEMDEVEVIDVATHPHERTTIIQACLESGRHVLSQKPFVTDLAEGERLVQLAQSQGVQLAVNQNGRWAPHFSYIREAIRQGVIGPVSSVDFALQWDHTWTQGTPFEQIYHLLLYDFAIHWFDITTVFLGARRPQQVFAAARRTPYQSVAPPFLAHVVVDYEDAQVRLALNAHVSLGQEDRTTVVGQDGTVRACGPGLNDQRVQLWTDAGFAQADIQGCWFDNGFQGAMGELLCAIEDGREPLHSARDNLRGLELCFAAIASADQHEPLKPGAIRQLPDRSGPTSSDSE